MTDDSTSSEAMAKSTETARWRKPAAAGAAALTVSGPAVSSAVKTGASARRLSSNRRLAGVASLAQRSHGICWFRVSASATLTARSSRSTLPSVMTSLRCIEILRSPATAAIAACYELFWPHMARSRLVVPTGRKRLAHLLLPLSHREGQVINNKKTFALQETNGGRRKTSVRRQRGSNWLWLAITALPGEPGACCEQG